MTPDFETRLRQLETKVGRQRNIFLSTVGALLLVLILGLAPADRTQPVISAREFRLISPDGQTRATFKIGDNLAPSLALLDKEGRPSVFLATDEEDRGMCAISDRDGARIALAA